MDKTLGATVSIIILICIYLFQLGSGNENTPETAKNDAVVFQNPASGGYAQTQQNAGSSAQTSETTNGSQAPPPPSSIIVGSFNIQKLGTSKMRNNDVTQILVDIIRRYDVLAIQEVTSIDQEIIPKLLNMVNASGHRYNFLLGPREGTTIYKEQYLYFFDTSRVELLPNATVLRDPRDIIERDPLAARFRCLQPNGQSGFTFTLLNIHTSPTRKELVPELESMHSMMGNLFAAFPDEDDFIILGDLNCPPRFFQDFGLLANQFPLIRDDWTTNVAGNRNLDNMIVDSKRTSEFMNQSGVFDIQSSYGLSKDQAKQVSDHNPIWAVFSAVEQHPVSMTQAPQVTR